MVCVLQANYFLQGKRKTEEREREISVFIVPIFWTRLCWCCGPERQLQKEEIDTADKPSSESHAPGD